MAGAEAHHPKVFISYSHDSREHADSVRRLSDRLRSEGIDCILDQYELSPSQGWPLWMDRHIRDSDFVLMICTKNYYRRVMREEKPGAGHGVRWEGNLIYQHIYDQGTQNSRFIPVLLDSGEVEHIPKPLKGASYYFAQTEDGYEDLYRRLTDQPRHVRAALGRLRELPPLTPKQDFFAGPLTNLPFERNPFFTGREEMLKGLHDALVKTGATALNQAISGLGGIGKTQTALEYAYRYAEDYNAVFWVRADSHIALSAGFVDIARLLNLKEKDAQNPDDTARAVNLWLQNNSGWLLIFDNADSPELLRDFRPRNSKGHVLLTSRAQVFDSLGIAKPLELAAMSPDEALEFLLTRTGRDDIDDAGRNAASRLASELGYLPLALEQAASFILAKKARFQDYIASYRKRRLELLKESKPVAGDYPESVATTWELSFHEVEKLSEAASDILRVSAFLSPDNIPFELLVEGREQLGPFVSAALADVKEDPLAINRVLEPLTRYSLIRLDSDSQTYNVHRLVQEVVKERMEADAKRQRANHAVLALNQAFPSVEFENWLLCERLLPHAKVVARLLHEWNIVSSEAMRVVSQAAVYIQERGQYSEAERLFKQALEFAEELFKQDDPNLAICLNNLAGVYIIQDKYAEAELLYKRALAIREKLLEPDHPSLAVGINNLAFLYRKQRKYKDAESLFKRSLAIKERVLESNHPGIANTLDNLACLYQEQGKYKEAEPLYKRALAIREMTLRPDDPELAMSLNNLSTLYYDQGMYGEAEPLIKRSVEIFEKTLGARHPYVAYALQNYAVLLHATGRDAEAKEIWARAEAILADLAQQDSAE
ncbi:MAG TPA: FxSxx-COOH system tetratricopeptide repeat protein [Blastocatellia bacterium]|nr:FxSxx-COOH system tetratricopeptide repeat protein [Blastocatellia bacterium]